MDQNGFGCFPNVDIQMKPAYSGYLVGGFEDELMFFHFMMMGCHPNPIDELHHFSRWAHGKPPSSILPAKHVSNAKDL